MKRFTIIMTVMLLSLFSFAGNWTAIKRNQPTPVQYQVVQSGETGTTIKFAISGFETTVVETPKGKQAIISVPKMVSLSEKGAPDLPKYAVSAIIGDNDLMDVRVIDAQYTDFQNVDIAPSKGDFSRQIDPATVPYTYGSVYSQNAFFPASAVALQEPYILRNFRGQAITLMPFSYNPVSRTLRVYHDITVELYKIGTGGSNVLNRSSVNEREDFEFKHLYANHFVNYENVQNRYPVLEEQGRLLIIAHAQFMEAMQPFVAWKKTIGRPTEMVDVASIGSTPSVIKDYILNYYNTNGLTHLLIVGDHQHVPSYNNTSSGGYSDNYYGYLAGNDSYNEVFVGRFSVESVAHVQTMVQRVLTYERDLDETANWLDIGTGVARNEGAGNGHNGGEADYVHMDYIRDSLLNYTYSTVHREYDGGVPGLPNTTAAQISARINAGTSIINYCNHGSQNSWSVAGYTTSHVNALTNTDRWPVIWAVACDNGKFTNGSCFAETWTRASNNGQPTGAIGTMMSWISQPWQPPMTGQDEMVTILVEGYQNNIKRTLGGNSINGSMRMIDLHGTSGRSTHDTWILFGDPSMTMRTANPVAMNITHMPTIFLGMSEFTVNADAEGATVALTVNGEIIGTGVISNGSATVGFAPLNNVGTMKVAVFGYNKVTYLQEIDIIPASGPFIAYISNTVNGATGSQVHYGSDVSLGIQLRNLGVANASNINVTLTTDSPWVTITDATENYGTLTPDQAVMIDNAFGFSLSDEVPNNTPLSFNLQITADEDSWQSSFTLNALAPSFSIGNYTVNDASGNGNGRLDPGETADIKVNFTNTGASQATDVLSTISFASGFITVNTATFEAATVDAGQIIEALFNITVSGATPVGQAVEFGVNVAAGVYQAQKTFTTKIGLILEDFETGDFTSFNWNNSSAQPWTIISSGAYEGTFAAKSGTITDNGSTVLILPYEVSANDTISFFRKVSSESGYDYMRFYIDGTKVGEWSGEVSWSRVAYPVTAGTHTFKWEYMKDYTVTSGSDCAWVDYITLPATISTNGWAGNNDDICAGETYQLNATATYYNSLLWTTSGTGTFSNATILNPVYTPGEADITAGSVMLKLTVTGNTSTVESEMTLYIHHSPEVFAGEAAAICHGNTLELNASTATNYSSLTWTSSGDGTFSDAASLHPVYTPGAADLAAGNAQLTLTANGQGGCAAASHAATLNIHSLPTAAIVGDQTVCEGQQATLTLNLTGAAPWTVTIAGMEAVTATETPWVMAVTPGAATTYSLSAVSDANCSNQAEGQAVVSMNFAPVAPFEPSTPDTIDHAFYSQSTVMVMPVADASSYVWSLEPAAAGTISGNTTDAVIAWAESYIGTATVKVAAVNDCGQGEWSPVSEVIVQSTIGLNENTMNSFRVFPNPSGGTFSIEINHALSNASLTVTNALGSVVYHEKLNHLAGSKSLELGHLSEGVYMISISSGQQVMMQRVTIRK